MSPRKICCGHHASKRTLRCKNRRTAASRSRPPRPPERTLAPQRTLVMPSIFCILDAFSSLWRLFHASGPISIFGAYFYLQGFSLSLEHPSIWGISPSLRFFPVSGVSFHYWGIPSTLGHPSIFRVFFHLWDMFLPLGAECVATSACPPLRRRVARATALSVSAACRPPPHSPRPDAVGHHTTVHLPEWSRRLGESRAGPPFAH